MSLTPSPHLSAKARIAVFSLLGLLAATTLPIAAQTSSLWQKDQMSPVPEGPRPQPTNQSIFADPPPELRNLKKHDLVTVLILERSSGDTKADSTIRKDMQLEAELKEFIRFKKNPGDLLGFRVENAASNAPGLDFEVQYNKRNRGQTKRTNTLAGKITAKVVKVLPNQNLIIEARKTRRVNDEIETMIVTGEIRSEDIGTDNTVLSERIADLKVAYYGKGTVNDAQKSGWFGRLLEWVWPF